MNTQHTFAILAYKESAHLQACIDSLKKQSIASEIILCTSTPSAFLSDMAAKNNLSLFVNPMRDGIAADWNFALSKAVTKYVTLAHQDDLYFPNYAAEIIAAAERRPDTLIAFSNYDEIVCKNNETCIRKKSLNFAVKKLMLWAGFGAQGHKFKNKQRLLSFGNPIGCPTVTFNKGQIGDFQFDRNFGINMDWKAWLDLARKDGSFAWVKKTLMSHRIYSESETSRGLAENRRQNEDQKIFTMLWPSYFAIMLTKIYSLSYKNNN